jgi:hypothetical protein
MQKLKAERSFCALGLYAGPPFCRAWLFTTPVFDHPSVGGEFFFYCNPVFGEGSIWLGLPGRGFLWWAL